MRKSTIAIWVSGFIMLVALASTTSAQEIFSDEPGQYSTERLTMSLSCQPGDLIEIRSAMTLEGTLEIIVHEDAQAHIDYFKKAKTGRKSNAIDYIDLISVSLSETPTGLKLDMRAPNPAPWSSRESGLVVVEVRIPADCEVKIEAPYFDVAAVGPFKAFEVPSSMGRLEVSSVTERLDLVTSNRRVTIENASGEVRAATTNSTLIANDIDCTGYQAIFRNEGGDIMIERLAGELNIKNSYGRIEIEDFRPTGRKNYIRGQYGPITVSVTRMETGQLIVNNRYEDVELSLPEDISAVFSLAVEEEGKIEVSNFEFKPDLIQQNRLNLVTGEGEALISSSIRGKGNIFVRGESEGGS